MRRTTLILLGLTYITTNLSPCLWAQEMGRFCRTRTLAPSLRAPAECIKELSYFADLMQERQKSIKALLAREMPAIIARKHGHIQKVIDFMELFVKQDVEGLYKTFSGVHVDREEYAALLNELFRRYQRLSPYGKEVLTAATILHDIGSRPGTRDWIHHEIGSARVREMLFGAGYESEFINDVAMLVYFHGLYWNIGLDFLPRDYAALSNEQRDMALLLQFFDNSGRECDVSVEDPIAS